MAETTTEILVREFVQSDGEHSVKFTDHITVQVIWPEEKPKNGGSYTICGEWRLL